MEWTVLGWHHKGWFIGGIPSFPGRLHVELVIPSRSKWGTEVFLQRPCPKPLNFVQLARDDFEPCFEAAVHSNEIAAEAGDAGDADHAGDVGDDVSNASDAHECFE